MVSRTTRLGRWSWTWGRGRFWGGGRHISRRTGLEWGSLVLRKLAISRKVSRLPATELAMMSAVLRSHIPIDGNGVFCIVRDVLSRGHRLQLGLDCVGCFPVHFMGEPTSCYFWVRILFRASFAPSGSTTGTITAGSVRCSISIRGR